MSRQREGQAGSAPIRARTASFWVKVTSSVVSLDDDFPGFTICYPPESTVYKSNALHVRDEL